MTLATIASTTVTDIGTLAAPLIEISGTTPIAHFGNTMAVGLSKRAIIPSDGLLITPTAKMIFNDQNYGTGYVSTAGDRIHIDCVGVDGSGDNIYGIDITQGQGMPYATAQNSNHQGLLVEPVPGFYGTKVDVKCMEMTLLSPQDRSSGFLYPGAAGKENVGICGTSHPKRITNIGYAHPCIVDLYASGSGGLDTGAPAANTDYYLWAASRPDGKVCVLWSASLAWPTLPAGYTKANVFYWNRTNASAVFGRPISKIAYRNTYINGSAPIVASGAGFGSMTPVLLTNLVSPTGGGENGFTVVYGNPAKQVLLGPDAATFQWLGTGAALSMIAYVRVSGYAGAIYVQSNDFGMVLQLLDFDDTI